MVEINAGKSVAKLLRDYGVRFVFGLPGGETLSLYDGIRELQPEIMHVLVRDERNGAFMADGYSRFSYRPGVCDGTAGPGALNMVTGIAESYYSSVPVVAITSDVGTSFAGRNPMHECDQVAIFRPITKWSRKIESAKEIPSVVRKAFRVATTRRPGPVMLDFPEDIVLSRKVEQNDLFIENEYREYPSRRVTPNLRRVKEAAELLLKSERAVMLVGGGAMASQAFDEVLGLATLLVIPVAVTMMGKGIMPESHPLSVGTPGLYGSRFANKVVKDSDLVLVVGSRLTDYDTAKYSVPRPNLPIIQIDVDPRMIGRSYSVKVGVIGDAKLTLKALIAAVNEKIRKREKSHIGVSRLQELDRLRKEWLDSIASKIDSSKFPCTPHRIVKEIRNHLAYDDILVCDASTAGLWASLLYQIPHAGRYYTAARGIAAIGYGFPAAIGAKMAVPQKRVLSFIGDGGFGLSLTELDTAMRTNTQITVVVHNNFSLGFIKFAQQAMFGGQTISVDYNKELDYSAIAESYGCFGRRIERPSEIADALKEAEQSGRPAVLDVPEDQSELVPQITLG